MAVLASNVPTLIDIVQGLAPDGSQLHVAEVLKQTNPILEDMTWMEGNLLTGHKDSVRTSLPEGSWRSLNAGVPITKGSTTPIEETCALLEDYSQVDAEIAKISGNVEAYRLKEGRAHIQGNSHKMARTLMYGNTAAGDGFTGFGNRFNNMNAANDQKAGQILDCGGTGTKLRSIYLIGWSHDTVTGIYPKNTVGGLQHEDVTTPGAGTDSMVLRDGAGNPYQGYMDHWVWRCGLMVKDYRYVVRAANIDVDALVKNKATGADIEDIMTQMVEMIEGLEGVRAAFYAPRELTSMLRRQMNNTKGTFLSWDEAGGKKVMNFGEVPVRRTDALKVNESRVISA